MTTTFSLLCHVCGLSHKEAASFLGVRRDTCKSWSAGRNAAPDGALDRLAKLTESINESAKQVVAGLPKEPTDMELGIAADDEEARELGWPYLGAHRAVIGTIAAKALLAGHRVEIVPHGSPFAGGIGQNRA